MNNRIDKQNYYLDMAEAALNRGTCLRRNYGAIIVKNDSIVSTGYTGAPRGRKNCCDIGFCRREKEKISSGQRYELCRSVHAEQNAVIAAGRDNAIGGTMYLVGIEGPTPHTDNDKVYNSNIDSCLMCKRVIINAGIEKVVMRLNKTEYTVIDVNDWIKNDDSLPVLD